MALVKEVVLSQIEVQPDGTLQVRFDKRVVDGTEVFSHEYHRTVVPPGISVDKQMAAVNAHLAEMSWPPVAREHIERIKRIAKVEHTKEAKAAYAQARKVAEQAAGAE